MKRQHKITWIATGGALFTLAAWLLLKPDTPQGELSAEPGQPGPKVYSSAAQLHAEALPFKPAENAGRYFGKGAPSTLAEIPPCELRTQLESLPAEAQQKALRTLAKMEFHENDLNSLHVDPTGGIFYGCTFGHRRPQKSAASAAAAAATAAAAEKTVASAPLTSAGLPLLHSKAGSSNILFLDFDGGTVSGTIWNDTYGVTSWNCRPYDTDSDETRFSASEQAEITEIWERVAEDYAPFNIDVTTEEPSSWGANVAHALITPGIDKNGVQCPHYGLGGLAYVDTFGWSDNPYYSPAWIFAYNDQSYAYLYADYTAEAAAHEIGHNMGLSHDGTTTDEYYGGHSNGGISWGPIMGAPYDMNLSQWSQGEYYQANNTQDDLAIISAKLSYRNDDHGNSSANASFLIASNSVDITSSSIVETRNNTDWFSFTTAAGYISISATPYRAASFTWGGDVDLALSLYDASSALLASDNPSTQASASIQTYWLDAGTYYVKVEPVGVGSPLSSTPSGYTSYGSLGQYTLSGTIIGDRDGDEMPDYWEELHFQNITNAVASADSDNDGQSNLAEYTAGFNPTDPNDLFTVTLQNTAAGIEISWTSLVDRSYQIEWSTNLITQGYQTLTSNLRYPQAAYVHNLVNSNAVYRIGVKLSE